jgi:hypothetical protein
MYGHDYADNNVVIDVNDSIDDQEQQRYQNVSASAQWPAFARDLWFDVNGRMQQRREHQQHYSKQKSQSGRSNAMEDVDVNDQLLDHRFQQNKLIEQHQFRPFQIQDMINPDCSVLQTEESIQKFGHLYGIFDQEQQQQQSSSTEESSEPVKKSSSHGKYAALQKLMWCSKVTRQALAVLNGEQSPDSQVIRMRDVDDDSGDDEKDDSSTKTKKKKGKHHRDPKVSRSNKQDTPMYWQHVGKKCVKWMIEHQRFFYQTVAYKGRPLKLTMPAHMMYAYVLAKLAQKTVAGQYHYDTEDSKSVFLEISNTTEEKTANFLWDELMRYIILFSSGAIGSALLEAQTKELIDESKFIEARESKQDVTQYPAPKIVSARGSIVSPLDSSSSSLSTNATPSTSDSSHLQQSSSSSPSPSPSSSSSSSSLAPAVSPTSLSSSSSSSNHQPAGATPSSVAMSLQPAMEQSTDNELDTIQKSLLKLRFQSPLLTRSAAELTQADAKTLTHSMRLHWKRVSKTILHVLVQLVMKTHELQNHCLQSLTSAERNHVKQSLQQSQVSASLTSSSSSNNVNQSAKDHKKQSDSVSSASTSTSNQQFQGPIAVSAKASSVLTEYLRRKTACESRYEEAVRTFATIRLQCQLISKFKVFSLEKLQRLFPKTNWARRWTTLSHLIIQSQNNDLKINTASEDIAGFQEAVCEAALPVGLTMAGLKNLHSRPAFAVPFPRMRIVDVLYSEFDMQTLLDLVKHGDMRAILTSSQIDGVPHVLLPMVRGFSTARAIEHECYQPFMKRYVISTDRIHTESQRLFQHDSEFVPGQLRRPVIVDVFGRYFVADFQHHRQCQGHPDTQSHSSQQQEQQHLHPRQDRRRHDHAKEPKDPDVIMLHDKVSSSSSSSTVKTNCAAIWYCCQDFNEAVITWVMLVKEFYQLTLETGHSLGEWIERMNRTLNQTKGIASQKKNKTKTAKTHHQSKQSRS